MYGYEHPYKISNDFSRVHGTYLNVKTMCKNTRGERVPVHLVIFVGIRLSVNTKALTFLAVPAMMHACYVNEPCFHLGKEELQGHFKDRYV